MRVQMLCPATNKIFHATLIDDGTLDTVFQCSECQERLRYINGDELDFDTDNERVRYFRECFEVDHAND